MQQHPQLTANVIHLQNRRLTRLIQLVEELSFKTVKTRLARMLADRDQYFPSDVRLTINDLAASAGTVREVMGRAFKELVDDGVLARGQGDIEVLNRPLLEAIASE